jgi:hypothetical protein
MKIQVVVLRTVTPCSVVVGFPLRHNSEDHDLKVNVELVLRSLMHHVGKAYVEVEV